jgi:glycosyltransferase involved in cell wall biosynthesis
MNIGVDAGPLRGAPTGVGWYVAEVIPRLARMAPADDFFLYSSRPLRLTFDDRNIHVSNSGRRSLMPGTFWLRAHARALAARDQLSCFWSPFHILPQNLPSRIRTVVTVHDLVWRFYPDSMSRYNLLVHQFYFGRSVRRADAIITVSAQTKRDLVRELDIAEERVTVIHQGAEAIFRSLSPDTVWERLAGLGVPREFILAVGTLEPRKNYVLLLRALARRPSGPTLVVAGRRGWKYRDVLEAIEQLNLQTRVLLLDYVTTENLVALYNGAKLLVLPSVYEGFGLPILQAMACGTPVLASRCSSLPEIGGDAARYFDAQSEESLVAELDALLRDAAARQLMRQRGFERAGQFTWERTAERTLKVLTGKSPDRTDGAAE